MTLCPAGSFQKQAPTSAGGRKGRWLMGIIMTILMLVLFFKITGFILKVLGAILGAVLSLLGYLLIGVIGVVLFGLAIFIVPVCLVVGLIAIFSRLALI